MEGRTPRAFPGKPLTREPEAPQCAFERRRVGSRPDDERVLGSARQQSGGELGNLRGRFSPYDQERSISPDRLIRFGRRPEILQQERLKLAEVRPRRGAFDNEPFVHDGGTRALEPCE